MKVALVTCDDLPDWEVDDRPFHDALAARGVQAKQVSWSDPTMDWSSVDLALLRTPWDYQERIEAFLAWAEAVDGVTRLEHPGDVVRWNSRKTYLRDLEARGVPIAPSVWTAPGEPVDWAAWRRETGATKGFVKPVVGATARETLRFEATVAGCAEAQAHIDRVGEPMIVQPYLASVEDVGEWSVVVIDGVPTHGVRKVPLPGDYRVQDDFGAHDEPLALTPALVGFAEAALGAARAVLGRDSPFVYGRVDLLHHQGRWVLNELEVIEPSLFFRHGPEAAGALADAVVRRLVG